MVTWRVLTIYTLSKWRCYSYLTLDRKHKSISLEVCFYRLDGVRGLQYISDLHVLDLRFNTGTRKLDWEDIQYPYGL
jgi:hypothetical protein